MAKSFSGCDDGQNHHCAGTGCESCARELREGMDQLVRGQWVWCVQLRHTAANWNSVWPAVHYFIAINRSAFLAGKMNLLFPVSPAMRGWLTAPQLLLLLCCRCKPVLTEGLVSLQLHTHGKLQWARRALLAGQVLPTIKIAFSTETWYGGPLVWKDFKDKIRSVTTWGDLLQKHQMRHVKCKNNLKK